MIMKLSGEGKSVKPAEKNADRTRLARLAEGESSAAMCAFSRATCDCDRQSLRLNGLLARADIRPIWRFTYGAEFYARSTCWALGWLDSY